MKKLFFIVILVFIGIVLPLHSVEANCKTVLVGDPNGSGQVYTTSCLDKDVYAPGEQVRATNISMRSYSPIVVSVQLGATTNGSSTATLLYDYISQGQEIYSYNSVLIGSAPSTLGTHNANFNAGYFVSPIYVSMWAAEAGQGNADSTLCIGKATIETPVSQDITIRVMVHGMPGGSSVYNYIAPSAEDLGTLDATIYANDTQSELVNSRSGAANGGDGSYFYCRPGESYEANKISVTPSVIDGREVQ